VSGRRPPRWLERILEWAVPSGLSGQGILGDLAEEFERRARVAPWGAGVWYAGQAISILAYTAVAGSGTESLRSDLLTDVRWSLRSMARHPGFALSVVCVLGVGLGANAAVFSVVDGTVRNTRWWADTDGAVSIWPENRFSYGQLDMYAEEQSVYDAVGGYVELAFSVERTDGESESVNGVVMTPELFRELAVQPVLGRGLSDDDARFGVEPVVVLGDALWRRSFGADPDIVGTRIDLRGVPVTVVGIQGPGATAPGGRAEVWLPLVVDPRDDDFWKAQSYSLVGMLRDGADLRDAHRDLMAFTNTLSDMFPMFYPQGFAEGLANVARADATQRRLISMPLMLLLAGTALLLMATALNVGNLLLGRALDRRKELSVRSSLGAGRGRIVTQLLVEGSVLTAIALAVGLATGSMGGRWIAGLFLEEAVVVSSPITSRAVLAVVVGLSALAWCVLNGVPVAHFLRSQRAPWVFAADPGAGLQRVLVSAQAALATLLLVSATLLVATVDNLRQVPLGFETRDLLTVELSPPADRVASIPAARDLYERLVERVGAVPGVRAVGLTGWLPLRRQAPATPINLESAPVDPREAMRVPMQMVDPGFFQVMGLQPSAGRLLTSEDRGPDAPGAVVVNETLARTLWPDGSAVGQRIAIDPHAWNRWTPVVGVVPDLRSGDITGPIGPALYVALAESPARDVTLMVRAGGGQAALAAMVRAAVKEVDPLVPIRAMSGMEDVVRAAYSTAWVMMGLLTVLALFSTALGAVGVYAVMAHHVTTKRREIGVRMALGAQPGAVVLAVVRSGAILVGLGIVIGCVAAAATTRFLASMLFGVSALAPWAFLAPALALTGAAVLAAWIPASRAGRLPPGEVLRSE
jgi:predicted permease